MSFFKFDFSSMPNIKVIFTGKITENNLNGFFKEWLRVNTFKTYHNLIFDTTNLDIPSIKVAIKIGQFIKNLRDEKPQYLQRSIIILNENIIIRNLTKIVFKITKPAAPVFIYWKKKTETNVNLDTILDIFNTNVFKFQFIKP
jgi:hypothetical protein